MTKSKWSPRQFRRQTFAQAVRGTPPVGAKTLEDGVLAVFPKASVEELRAWLEDVARMPGVEPERLLFLALICGHRFGISHRKVEPYLERLYSWLTWRPRNMEPDLAELVVEALMPGMEEAVARRGGWRVGHEGAYVRKVGRPPEARGAWVACLLVEQTPIQTDSSPVGREAGLGLVRVLRGREDVENYEYYRTTMSREIGKVAQLLKAVLAEFDRWVAIEGNFANDPAPETRAPGEGESIGEDEDDSKRSGRAGEIAAWREKHRGLSHVLETYGCAGLALKALWRIPGELWQDLFNDPEAAQHPRALEQDSATLQSERADAEIPPTESGHA